MLGTLDDFVKCLQGQRATYLRLLEEAERFCAMYRNHPLGPVMEEQRKLTQMALNNIDEAITTASRLEK
jgi:hypothetical protein